MNHIPQMNLRGNRAFSILETALVGALIALLALFSGQQAMAVMDYVACVGDQHNARHVELAHLIEGELGGDIGFDHAAFDAKVAAATQELQAAFNHDIDAVAYHPNGDGSYTVTVDVQQLLTDADLAGVSEQLQAALDSDVGSAEYHPNGDGSYTVVVDGEEITLEEELVAATEELEDALAGDDLFGELPQDADGGYLVAVDTEEITLDLPPDMLVDLGTLPVCATS